MTLLSPFTQLEADLYSDFIQLLDVYGNGQADATALENALTKARAYARGAWQLDEGPRGYTPLRDLCHWVREQPLFATPAVDRFYGGIADRIDSHEATALTDAAAKDFSRLLAAGVKLKAKLFVEALVTGQCQAFAAICLARSAVSDDDIARYLLRARDLKLLAAAASETHPGTPLLALLSEQDWAEFLSDLRSKPRRAQQALAVRLAANIEGIPRTSLLFQVVR
jgi:hypothetical protein